MPISKTDFIRGLQCEKMLWLDAHAPELRSIPPEIQAKLDAGNDFGDAVMSLFGDFVETTCYRADGRLDFSEMISKTQNLIQAGVNVICEGSFSWYGNFCAADILKKDGTGYALYEVKNSQEIRKEFLLDLGFQRLIIRKCGVPVTSCFLILRGDEEQVKNTKAGGQGCVEYVNHQNFALKIIDVTKQARAFEKTAEANIFSFGKIKKKDAPQPQRSIGKHCENPYLCWYYDYCKGK